MAKDITESHRKLTFQKFNAKCAYCGCDINYQDFHVDHIVPKNRGYNNEQLSLLGLEKGKNIIENYNPSCKQCNSSKSNLSIDP